VAPNSEFSKEAPESERRRIRPPQSGAPAPGQGTDRSTGQTSPHVKMHSSPSPKRGGQADVAPNSEFSKEAPESERRRVPSAASQRKIAFNLPSSQPIPPPPARRLPAGPRKEPILAPASLGASPIPERSPLQDGDRNTSYYGECGGLRWGGSPLHIDPEQGEPPHRRPPSREYDGGAGVLESSPATNMISIMDARLSHSNLLHLMSGRSNTSSEWASAVDGTPIDWPDVSPSPAQAQPKVPVSRGRFEFGKESQQSGGRFEFDAEADGSLEWPELGPEDEPAPSVPRPPAAVGSKGATATRFRVGFRPSKEEAGAPGAGAFSVEAETRPNASPSRLGRKEAAAPAPSNDRTVAFSFEAETRPRASPSHAQIHLERMRKEAAAPAPSNDRTVAFSVEAETRPRASPSHAQTHLERTRLGGSTRFVEQRKSVPELGPEDEPAPSAVLAPAVAGSKGGAAARFRVGFKPPSNEEAGAPSDAPSGAPSVPPRSSPRRKARSKSPKEPPKEAPNK